MSSIADFPQKLEKYLADVGHANEEEAKAFFFLELVRTVFSGVNLDYLDKLFPLLQQHLRRRSGLGLIGRPDAFLGNLLIEFKFDLKKDREQAESQLRLYTAILWSNQAKKRVNYLTMACDGERFVVYKPLTKKLPGELIEPEDIELVKLDSMDLGTARSNPNYVFVWLDRYILFKSKISPTGEAFAERFGHESPSYKQAAIILSEAWNHGKNFGVVYEEWSRYLRYVYGSEVGSEDLFLKHTYLATLAKFMVYLYYSEGKPPGTREELLGVIRGLAFKQWNIRNFLEEDFFSWVGRKEVQDNGVIIGELLLDVLGTFDLAMIDEDILKALYQELVDPSERHDLGEYYTPDWLAEYVVEDVLGKNPELSLLDPACGSGTFLVVSLHYKQKLLSNMNAQALLDHLSESVVGIDIHPLAVIVSKTNYLLAVRDLLKKRRGSFSVPVYMANSIVLPAEIQEVTGGVRAYSLAVNLGHKDAKLQLPTVISDDPSLIDPVIEELRNYSEALVQGRKPDKSDFRNQIEKEVPSLSKLPQYAIMIDLLYETSLSMKTIMEAGRDTIWPFILRNIYRPLFLSKRKFGAIVGNPPWLSFRYVNDVRYQRDLKALMKKYEIFPEAKLITQMELATLFLLRTADLYLEPHGIISFVMPRSIFVADQHNSFRKRTKIVGIERLYDFEEVTPLFNVPSCVVKAKKGVNTTYPVHGIKVAGKLSHKNEKLSTALKTLTISKTNFVLGEVGTRSFLAEGEKPIKFEGQSAYYSAFTQGATIVPRSCWIVDPVVNAKMGFDPTYPYVQSSQRAIETAKEGYKDVRLEGNVESRFLFSVVTGSELVPFTHSPLPMAVLPIQPLRDGYKIVRKEAALNDGNKGLASWLDKAERVWKQKRGEKAIKMDIYSRLDYSHTLTQQNPKRTFKVVYNTSGSNLVSCVLPQGRTSVQIDGQQVKLQSVIADAKVYRFETDNEDEAYFVCAILNSTVLDRLVKPLQSRGQWGERDFHKKPLEFPIPRYDHTDKLHRRLAEVAKTCEAEATKLLPSLLEKYTSLGKIRGEIRDALEDKVQEIDDSIPTLFGKNREALDAFLTAS